MTTLSLPSPDLYDAWLDCIRDFGGGPRDGSGDWQVANFGADRASFETLLALTRLESDRTRSLRSGHVHSDYYWVTQGAEMIGFLALRHSIDTDFLRTEGGHIGYSIRPSHRRQGHASRALGLALERARELALARLLLTCDEDNVASARTIQAQGGVFESVCHGKRRYWIEL